MSSLHVEIVTPEALLWSGDARSLIARSTSGLFTVLPQHTDTVGDLVPGVVRVDAGESEQAFCVHGGYFQVVHGGPDGVTHATVLASVAERTTDIDVARAQRAKEGAEAQLAGEARDADGPPSHSLAHAALERAELRLSAAQR